MHGHSYGDQIFLSQISVGRINVRLLSLGQKIVSQKCQPKDIKHISNRLHF
jgi:hypothetical protein